jgi:hypothetical protein
VLTNLTMSATYRARYRALNVIGFGEWSEPAYLLVAAAPDAPLKPVLQSVDESLISIVLPQSSSNNGAPITGY